MKAAYCNVGLQTFRHHDLQSGSYLIDVRITDFKKSLTLSADVIYCKLPLNTMCVQKHAV